MKVGTYTGNGLSGGQSITGVGFSPELVFIMSGKRHGGHPPVVRFDRRRTISRTAAAPPGGSPR